MPVVRDRILYSKDYSTDIDHNEVTGHFQDKLVNYIQGDLEAHGDRIVLTEVPNPDIPSRHLTLKRSLVDLLPQSSRIARALIQNGFQPGDVAQISMYNNSDFLFPVLGVWLAGGVVSLSDPGLSPNIMMDQLSLTHSQFIFCGPYNVDSNRQAIQAMARPPRIILVNGQSSGVEGTETLEQFVQGMEASNPKGYLANTLDDVATIVWSSGTTGKPKGVNNSNRNMIQILDSNFFSPESQGPRVFLFSTCMFHASFLYFITNLIKFRASLVLFSLADPITVDMVLKAVDRFQPDNLQMGPHHLSLLAQSGIPPMDLDLSSVKRIVPVGSALSRNLIPQLEGTLFPNAQVWNAFGTTETGGISRGPGLATLGDLLPGVKAKIVDPDSQELLGSGQSGELWVHTPTIFVGYYNLTVEENSSFFDAEGFVSTGDLVSYDANGTLLYLDRLKALMKHNRWNISPSDVEQVLETHPEVLNAGVFGLPHPLHNELVTAAIVRQPGSVVTEEELRIFMSQKAQSFQQCTGGIFFVKELPRNLQGKLLRRELKTRFMNKV